MNNEQGNENAFFGRSAGYSNRTGSNNSFFGRQAGTSNISGTYNTVLGNIADVSSGSLTNAMAIGYAAIVSASNTVQIGNSAISDVYFGNGTAVLHANSVITPSDKRFKYNIQNNVPGLDFTKKLQPVTYYFDEQKLAEYTKTGIINNSIIKPASYSGIKQLHTGFLAQDVERTANELGYRFDGVHTPANDKDHYSLSYSQFIMPLVKSVQEQQQIIEEQNLQINKQQTDVEILKQIIDNLTKKVNSLMRN